ncbi:MAG TPA: APC family permease [Terriglobia bacterium]|jgi:putrescine importer|nr:APC family permease [Terriglobia bacterium]
MADRSSTAPSTSGAPTPHLRRVLSVNDLIFYGIVLIQPIAPVPLFGVAQSLSNGFFLDTIMIAMFAMLITAVSYGRMAAIYPSAGSAYTYVGRGLNAHLGFLVGWAMFLDYLLQPLINTVWIATAIHSRYLPQVPYVVAAAFIAIVITLLNLAGVKSNAEANKVMLVAMFAVLGVFLVLAVHFLYHGGGWSGLFSVQPFYDPATFDAHRIWGATSFAALTYIGFDGVTTLSEEVVNPKRNVLVAVVTVCLFAGIFSGIEAYLGARVWPDWHTFSNLETAFMDVCHRVGGMPLFHAMGAVLIVAAFGSALTGSMGAARLLYGMGRDNVLPRGFFGYLGARSKSPTYNILLIGALSFLGAAALGYYGQAYEHAGELMNFGAFIAFMGVNFAAFWQFSILRSEGRKPRVVRDILLPLGGFLFCGIIWWNLSRLAWLVGGLWFAIGMGYLAYTTRGFRQKPAMVDFSDT